MITVAEAIRILQDNLPEPRIINISLEDAFGRRLAEDINAPEPSPRYTSSAMDGYALRWDDVHGVSVNEPAKLSIVGESQAGVPYENSVGAGEAIRISTGAMVPEGADTVVRVEDTEETDGKVAVFACKKQGQDVRYAGEEFAAGTQLMEQGLVLKSRQIAQLSSVGVKTVAVYDTPLVSLFITGTELAHYGDGEIKPFQVRDSNAPMLKAAILEAGGRIAECMHVEDDFEVTVESMRKALQQDCDIILCSGGVSVGRHDHVKEAAEQVGFEQLFWKIRQKPGKPLFVAKKGRTLLFGLPGNPVSAFMCFQNYVIPSLAALQGVSHLKKTISAKAEVAIENSGKRTDFIRVVITDEPNSIPTIKPISQQGSHMLSSIVKADGYIAVEAATTLAKGELTDVFVF
ncbi:gephyrin-like molybdotransferase Glp [Desulfosediminicola flagellatus]|uniref:molybdopterin molybdotransferase MoeA n=1 Tax=Desulfosediminicola flagellatus TaxID=2569541 RepID=UPI00142F033B|nr:gephyrin-like molybdotransferase Glp [Desulfosediminicola flagellatus]